MQILYALAAGIFVLWLLAWWLGRNRSFQAAEQGRPRCLKGATAVHIPHPLAMSRPLALHGEPDVVYRTPKGTLIIREDKSGFEHPLADRIQLSVYGSLLRHAPPEVLRGSTVEAFGLLRYGVPGETPVRWKVVQLLTDQELARLVAAYRALPFERRPKPARDPGYCRKVCRHFRHNCAGSSGGIRGR